MRVLLLTHTPEPERLIEQAGRTCYKSQDKITNESSGPFIRMLIRSGHESVLEHASATFRVEEASRAFTHQLVRHRLCSFSQQSQRYVKEDELHLVLPPSIAHNKTAWEIYNKTAENIEHAYKSMIELGIPKEDARFILPNATSSEIVFTANFRQLRHMLKLRLSKKAQWEIRAVARDMLSMLTTIAPNCFGDINGQFPASRTQIETMKGA